LVNPSGNHVAIKIVENINGNIEEINEEYKILSGKCNHHNLPKFFGVYLKLGSSREEDQLWFALEVKRFYMFSSFLTFFLLHPHF
jgi:myosin iii